jgi:hypothetical protein
MDNINISEMLSKYSKNVNTKISAGYSLSGKELLTVTEAKAAIKEIVEAVVDKCAVEAESKDVKVPACDDHTPYRGACVSCGRYDNPDVIISSEVDKHSILNIKTQINYGI